MKQLSLFSLLLIFLKAYLTSLSENPQIYPTQSELKRELCFPLVLKILESRVFDVKIIFLLITPCKKMLLKAFSHYPLLFSPLPSCAHNVNGKM